jgi:hypothetical protein
VTDKRDLIAEARRLNHDMQATIDRLLAIAKPARALKQRSAKARIRAVVEAARAVGIDPQTVEVDGVKVTGATAPAPDEFEAWKAGRDARKAQRLKQRQQEAR